MPLRTMAVMQSQWTRVQLVLYLCQTLKILTPETDANNELTVLELWQTLYSLDCVHIVGESQKELSTRLLNVC
jgi:hypothetical protein